MAALPQHSAWGIASFRNRPPRRPPGVSSLPGRPPWSSSLPGSTARAACPGSAFPRCQKVPVLSLNPIPPLHSSRPGWGLCWEEPQTPLLSVPQEPRSQPDPGCLSSVRVLGLAPTPSSSLRTALQTLPSAARASACPGAGSALREAPPTSLHTPPRAVPSPSGVTPGERCPLLAPPWGVEDGVGSPRAPHNSLYICINKRDFNGAPAPMSLSLCDSLSVSSLALHSLPLFISLFFWIPP